MILLFEFFILEEEVAHQWLPKQQNAFLDISATILLWMLWSRSPEVLAFWWPSRRRTFYSRWFFSYQVLLQSTLFSALNTLHTGLVLTTCQQIRYWFLLSFSFFEPCKNIAKKKLKLFTPWKRWEPSLASLVQLANSTSKLSWIKNT